MNKKQQKRLQRRVATSVMAKRRENVVPRLMTTMPIKHIFRWTASAGGSSVWNGNNLLRILQLCTASTTTALIFGAAKIRKVCMYAQPVALGTENISNEIIWAGGNSPAEHFSEPPMGVAPAVIISTPPKQSSSSWWVTSGGTNLTNTVVTTTYSLGAIVDLHMEFRSVDIDTDGTAGKAGTGLGVGNLVQGSPDANLNPVGYTEFSTTTTFLESEQAEYDMGLQFLRKRCLVAHNKKRHRTPHATIPQEEELNFEKKFDRKKREWSEKYYPDVKHA